jgi:hypothetical protein
VIFLSFHRSFLLKIVVRIVMPGLDFQGITLLAGIKGIWLWRHEADRDKSSLITGNEG